MFKNRRYMNFVVACLGIVGVLVVVGWWLVRNRDD